MRRSRIGFPRSRLIISSVPMTDVALPEKRTHEAFWPTDLFEKGIGWVIVARFRSGGRRIETGVFRVDVACLGAKRAVYDDYWTPETFGRTSLIIISASSRWNGPSPVARGNW